MWYAIQRLWLGFLLIGLTSAILLITDSERRATGAGHVPKIAVLQHASTTLLDDGIRGLLEGLDRQGFHDGRNIVVQRFNAHGDMATGIAIARQITAGDYDLVVTSSTPSMQAVANNNREGKVRHVFFLVADPFQSGVGLDRRNPLKHPAHMVGQGTMVPVEESFQIARQCLPSLRTVGVAWNPAETNSAIFTAKGRESARGLGLTLLEANVDSTSGVADAVNSLIARGAQALWVGGDNTVIAAVDSVIAIGRRAGVPVFSLLPGRPERGTLFDVGPDFVEAGRQASLLVADLLRGADPVRIPIRDVLDMVPSFLSVNATVLTGLKERWRIPDEVRQRATVLVDDAGVHRRRRGDVAALERQ
jgi:putative ABC transport system substrate-binding protein